MAKKADLLAQAKKLGLEVTEKNTITEIEAALKAGSNIKAEEVVVKEEKSNVNPTAKAGKRSGKALKEAEEKTKKEERKTKGDTSPRNPDADTTAKKGPAPKTRPKIERRGKKYQDLAKQVDKTKAYALKDALELATKTSPSKFDASVELHVNLGVDPRQSDQNIRGTVKLPHGSGKTVRVAVIAPSKDHEAAKKAGADIVGEDDFLQQLDKEQINFDVLIATPQFMPKLGKYARVLGPRGLMPNPKSGTVAVDVGKATKEAKTGKVEYRVDKQAIVHLSVGKVSFGTEKLNDNAKAIITSLQNAKPSSIKGTYLKNLSISTTMGPGIKVDTASI